MQVPHNGSILGNHCMILGEKGDLIISKITSEMKALLPTEFNAVLDRIDSILKKILSKWYTIMCITKNINKQSENAIDEFETNTLKLTHLITELCITSPPIHGFQLKLPTSLKAHLLMGCRHVLEQLRMWKTLGSTDEQKN